LHGGMRLRLGWDLPLGLPRLPLRRALLAALVLAAAPPAPMPLRLSLAVGRDRPQFSLGLRRFCRHACTSWQCAVWCIAFLRSAAVRAAAELPLPAVRPDSDRIPPRPAICSLEDIPQIAAEFRSAQSASIPRRIAPLLPCRTLRRNSTGVPPGLCIDSLRQVLSSGNALPMGVSTACAWTSE
jgi:hypothetical protein